MRPNPVIPAKAGIHLFDNITIMDTGFRQYDALQAFWDRLSVLSLPKHAKRFFGISILNT